MKYYSLSLILLLLLNISATPASAEDWPQDGHDAGHTGYTQEEPSGNWTYRWMWSSGQNTAPKEGRAIIGGNNIFIPSGSRGLYSLNLSTGNQVWNFSGATFNASAAYDASTKSIFAGATNGTLYKLDATNGSNIGTYSAGSPINKAIILANGYAYLVTDNGQLHKVKTSDMSRAWVYSSNSQGSTPAAYSANYDTLVFATADLYVHAVSESNGSLRWRVKPNQHVSPGFPNTFDKGWPVIADSQGVVFVRMQLAHDVMTAWPSNLTTNSAIKNYLNGSAAQNLYALDLNNGSQKFVPAVGYGSVEDYYNGAPYGVMGTQPVVKTLTNGKQVAYMPFRNSQRNGTDYRWNGHMGEMVLDDNTVPGYQAGDMRFIKMSMYSYNGQSEGGSSFIHIIDEQLPITVAGNTIFHAHWGGSESVTINNRADNLGSSLTNPITSTNRPTVVRTLGQGGSVSNDHTYTGWADMYGDGRAWPNGGFWVYRGQNDPAGRPQSAGYRPLVTIVGNGHIVVEGNGGDLFVLKHSGSSGTPLPTSPPTNPPNPSPTPTFKPGDADGDGRVDGVDYSIWHNNYTKLTSLGVKAADFNLDGRVDGVDYSIWHNNY